MDDAGRGHTVRSATRRLFLRGPLRASVETILQYAPAAAFELARRGETILKMVQGKGWSSARTLSSEVSVSAGLLPASDAIVFDVGANIGDWSRELIRIAGTRLGRIIAFEPSVANFAALEQIAFPGFEHVKAAVGDAPGEMTLFSDAPGSGTASLYQRRMDHFGLVQRPQESVRVTSLDAFTTERGIERIDFLKLDIEGHELRALEGARRLLTERRIRALSFEFGGCNIDSRSYFQDFWYLLRGAGFGIYRIVPRQRLLAIPRYTEDLEMFSTTNYIAKLEIGS